MTRRRFLDRRATPAMGLAVPPARGLAQPSGPGPEMSALSAYMSAAATSALPAEPLEHAKHHLLDTLASMISGSELPPGQDRKSTRLNSSHQIISYDVFCLKKKQKYNSSLKCL